MKTFPAGRFVAAIGAETDGHNAGAADGDGLRFRGSKWWTTQTSRTKAASRRWTMCSLENAEMKFHFQSASVSAFFEIGVSSRAQWSQFLLFCSRSSLILRHVLRIGFERDSRPLTLSHCRFTHTLSFASLLPSPLISSAHC